MKCKKCKIDLVSETVPFSITNFAGEVVGRGETDLVWCPKCETNYKRKRRWIQKPPADFEIVGETFHMG